MPVLRTDALRSAGGHRAGPAVVGRGRRLAVVVSAASAVVAFGVTGAGLLVPGREPTSLSRLVGAVAAIGAAGALARIEGPARGATTLVVVSVAGLAVCLVTLPASPVGAPWESSPDGVEYPAPDGGEGRGPEVVIEPGGGGGAGHGALGLPPGADVVVEGGSVVLVLPGGGRLIIGQATVDGAPAGIGPGGAVVVVDEDGTARRDDGGALGPDVALGGVVIQRDDGSNVAVADEALLEVPAPLEPDDGASEHLDALLAVLLGCFALLAFAPPVVRFSDRARIALVDPVTAEGPEVPRPVSPTVEEGLAGVLRSMLADPDPRTSVIGAYARLLAALAEAGFPRREEEGPHEHLWRSLGPLGVRRQPVHQLTELFVRARFTPRPVTEEHRQAAITALADAVADLRLQAADVREVAALVGAPS